MSLVSGQSPDLEPHPSLASTRADEPSPKYINTCDLLDQNEPSLLSDRPPQSNGTTHGDSGDVAPDASATSAIGYASMPSVEKAMTTETNVLEHIEGVPDTEGLACVGDKPTSDTAASNTCDKDPAAKGTSEPTGSKTTVEDKAKTDCDNVAQGDPIVNDTAQVSDTAKSSAVVANNVDVVPVPSGAPANNAVEDSLAAKDKPIKEPPSPTEKKENTKNVAPSKGKPLSDVGRPIPDYNKVEDPVSK